MKTVFFTALFACMVANAQAQWWSGGQSSESGQSPHGASTPASGAEASHGWSSHRGGQPGHMTAHGWEAGDPDCSLKGVEISGSAGVRCMR